MSSGRQGGTGFNKPVLDERDDIMRSLEEHDDGYIIFGNGSTVVSIQEPDEEAND